MSRSTSRLTAHKLYLNQRNVLKDWLLLLGLLLFFVLPSLTGLFITPDTLPADMRAMLPPGTSMLVPSILSLLFSLPLLFVVVRSAAHEEVTMDAVHLTLITRYFGVPFSHQNIPLPQVKDIRLAVPATPDMPHNSDDILVTMGVQRYIELIVPINKIEIVAADKTYRCGYRTEEPDALKHIRTLREWLQQYQA